MIGRRALGLLAVAPAALTATPTTAQSSDYRWKVVREGTEIGTHSVVLRREGDTLTAVSEVLVTPRVLGVVVYRFEHRYTEVTRGNRFVSVRSRLNRNGTVIDVEAEAGPGAVTVRGPGGTLRLPAEAAPLSWWQPQRFGGAVPIFGTTTGRPMELRWTREARAGGGTRWRCAGEVDAVLDYDAQGRWVAYSVRGDDGSTVSYLPG